MKKTARYAAIILGLLLVAAGLYLIKTDSDPQGVMLTLPFVCIGIGCGLFGSGMGELVSARAVRGNPEIQKNLEIEKKDERNIAIASRAKGKAFDIMTYVFGALLLTLTLRGTDTIDLLLLVFAYLFVHGLAIYYHFKLNKEM